MLGSEEDPLEKHPKNPRQPTQQSPTQAARETAPKTLGEPGNGSTCVTKFKISPPALDAGIGNTNKCAEAYRKIGETLKNKFQSQSRTCRQVHTVGRVGRGENTRLCSNLPPNPDRRTLGDKHLALHWQDYSAQNKLRHGPKSRDKRPRRHTAHRSHNSTPNNIHRSSGWNQNPTRRGTYH